MAELPFELQKLPGAALDVLRFFAQNDNQPADDLEIMDGAGLTERSFSKAIKRLITKKFAEMDAARMYKLTDKGVDLMDALLEYDEAHDGTTDEPAEAEAAAEPPQPVQRRLTMVVPEPLKVGTTAQIFVGVDDGFSGRSADVLLRVSALNGEPETQEQLLSLNGTAAHTSFHVTAGEYKRIRLRVQAFQADEFSGDFHAAGGMYVDVDVTQDDDQESQLAAYGTDVTVLPG
jgi:predicted transcriptional regulator